MAEGGLLGVAFSRGIMKQSARSSAKIGREVLSARARLREITQQSKVRLEIASNNAQKIIARSEELARLEQEYAKTRSEAERSNFAYRIGKTKDAIRALMDAELADGRTPEQSVRSEREAQQAKAKEALDTEQLRLREAERARQARAMGLAAKQKSEQKPDALDDSGIKNLAGTQAEVAIAKIAQLQKSVLKQAALIAYHTSVDLAADRQALIDKALSNKVQNAATQNTAIEYENVMASLATGQAIVAQAQINIRKNLIEIQRIFSGLDATTRTAMAEAAGINMRVNDVLFKLVKRSYAQTGDPAKLRQQLTDTGAAKTVTNGKIENVFRQVQLNNDAVTSAIDASVSLGQSVEALAAKSTELTTARDGALQVATTYRNTQPASIEAAVKALRDQQTASINQGKSAEGTVLTTLDHQTTHVSVTEGFRIGLANAKTDAVNAESGSVDAFSRTVGASATTADATYRGLVESAASMQDGATRNAPSPSVQVAIATASASIPARVQTAPSVSEALGIELSKLQGIKSEVDSVPLASDLATLNNGIDKLSKLTEPGGPADMAAQRAKVIANIDSAGKNHDNTVQARDAMAKSQEGMPVEPSKSGLQQATIDAKNASDAAEALRTRLNINTKGLEDSTTIRDNLAITLEDATISKLREIYKTAAEKARSAREKLSKETPAKPSVDRFIKARESETKSKDDLTSKREEGKALESVDPSKNISSELSKLARARLEIHLAKIREAAVKAEARRRMDANKGLRDGVNDGTKTIDARRADMENARAAKEKAAEDLDTIEKRAREEGKALEEAMKRQEAERAAHLAEIRQKANEIIGRKESERLAQEAAKRLRDARDARDARDGLDIKRDMRDAKTELDEVKEDLHNEEKMKDLRDKLEEIEAKLRELDKHIHAKDARGAKNKLDTALKNRNKTREELELERARLEGLKNKYKILDGIRNKFKEDIKNREKDMRDAKVRLDDGKKERDNKFDKDKIHRDGKKEKEALKDELGRIRDKKPRINYNIFIPILGGIGISALPSIFTPPVLPPPPPPPPEPPEPPVRPPIDESGLGCRDATNMVNSMKDSISQRAFAAGFAKAKASVPYRGFSGYITAADVTGAVVAASGEDEENADDMDNSFQQEGGQDYNNSEAVVNNSQEVANNSEGVTNNSQEAVNNSQEVVNNSEAAVNNSQAAVNNSEAAVNNSQEVVNNSEEAVNQSTDDSVYIPRVGGIVNNTPKVPNLNPRDAEPTRADLLVGKPDISMRSRSYQNGMNGNPGFNQCWDRTYKPIWVYAFIKGYQSYKPPYVPSVLGIPYISPGRNSKPTTTNDEEVQPNLGEVQPNLGEVQPNLGEVEPNLGSVEQNLGSVQPNLGEVQPNLGEVEPNLGEVQPNLGEVEPNLGEVDEEVVPNLGELDEEGNTIYPDNGSVEPTVEDEDQIYSDNEPVEPTDEDEEDLQRYQLDSISDLNGGGINQSGGRHGQIIINKYPVQIGGKSMLVDMNPKRRPPKSFIRKSSLHLKRGRTSEKPKTKKSKRLG